MPTTLYRRALGRKTSHREHMLRNLVTSLFTHETITTTWERAKETQRMADKLITLAKRNTEVSKDRARSFLWHPDRLIPTIFGEIRERYEDRPGGYTRVLRMGPRKRDAADIAMLTLVDGPRDVRFWMTAAATARQLERQVPVSRAIDKILKEKDSEKDGEVNGLNGYTVMNIRKLLRYTGDEGKESFKAAVAKMKNSKSIAERTFREWDEAEKEVTAKEDVVAREAGVERL